MKIFPGKLGKDEIDEIDNHSLLELKNALRMTRTSLLGGDFSYQMVRKGEIPLKEGAVELVPHLLAVGDFG
jgi:hypothetical protein